MTPQSSFMIAAPIEPGRMENLRALLAGMNIRPGIADRHNALFPFGRFEGLHVARFVVVEDVTAADLKLHGVEPVEAAPFLAFLGDHDGPSGPLLDAFAAQAAPGLKKIFGHCRGFSDGTDLRAWMSDHGAPSAAQYNNWMGRTLLQIQEEAALHTVLRQQLDAGGFQNQPPRAVFERLRDAVRGQSLKLTPPAPTPIGWRLRQVVHLVGGLLLAGVAMPILVLAAPLVFWYLRRLERSDPVIVPPLDPAHVRALETVEDQDVTNGFTVVGSIKPGRFRRVLMSVALLALDFTMRHIYVRGRLARVGTIHFARWVFIDHKRRMLFASNYDGREEAYMDDFINKAGFGLNLVFSNGVGYPRTSFLLGGGASDEQAFKRLLRRHQIPNDVWYKAYPGLTTADLDRNAKLRTGFESDGMSDAELRQWLALI